VHDEGEGLRVHLVDQQVEPFGFGIRVGGVAKDAEGDRTGGKWRKRRATGEQNENQGQTTFSPSPGMKAENVVCP